MDLDAFIKAAEVDLTSEAMKTPWAMFLGYATVCFVVSVVSGNYSQVDKLWSIVPTTYVWYYAVLSGGDPRLLVSGWMIRLGLGFGFWLGYV